MTPVLPLKAICAAADGEPEERNPIMLELGVPRLAAQLLRWGEGGRGYTAAPAQRDGGPPLDTHLLSEHLQVGGRREVHLLSHTSQHLQSRGRSNAAIHPSVSSELRSYHNSCLPFALLTLPHQRAPPHADFP